MIQRFGKQLMLDVDTRTLGCVMSDQTLHRVRFTQYQYAVINACCNHPYLLSNARALSLVEGWNEEICEELLQQAQANGTLSFKLQEMKCVLKQCNRKLQQLGLKISVLVDNMGFVLCPSKVLGGLVQEQSILPAVFKQSALARHGNLVSPSHM